MLKPIAYRFPCSALVGAARIYKRQTDILELVKYYGVISLGCRRTIFEDEQFFTLFKFRCDNIIAIEESYGKVDAIIRKKIEESKEKWTQAQSDEAERLLRLRNSFHLHKKMKEITGTGRKTSITMIKNEQGEPILESDELKRVWKEYAETLSNDQRTNLNPAFRNENMSGPKILESEVRQDK
ncbi:hypothetical protein HHI36_019106 [Cryptolaemus montrouzieri]|uniref:Uncharacterized protein n=1 Tax=Cryptolaemus montrouzieri TaxID=559131 RepID=A0ABD2P214_9CUCU